MKNFIKYSIIVSFLLCNITIADPIVKIHNFYGEGLQPYNKNVRTFGNPQNITETTATINYDGKNCNLIGNGFIDFNPNVLWIPKGVVTNINGVATMQVSSMTDRPNWFPNKIIFIGDSLTDGLDASSPDKMFINVLKSKLQNYYNKTVTNNVVFGVSDSQLKGMEISIFYYNGDKTCDAIVLEDAVTGDSIMDDGIITELAKINITSSGALGSITGYTIINPGKGYRLNDPVYFRKLNVVNAEGRVTSIDSNGGILSINLTNAGMYYQGLGQADVMLNSYSLVSKRLVNDLLNRFGNSGHKPVIFYLSCWRQGFTTSEYPKGSGNIRTWNDNLKWIYSNPPYRNNVVFVDVDPVWLTPGTQGIAISGTINDANSKTWTINAPLNFNPVGQDLYLIDETDSSNKFYSKIVSYSGTNITVADSRGITRPWVQLRIAQKVDWKVSGRYGDTYHPTDLGMEMLAETIFQKMKTEIEKSKGL